MTGDGTHYVGDGCRPAHAELPPLPPKWSAPLTEDREHVCRTFAPEDVTLARPLRVAEAELLRLRDRFHGNQPPPGGTLPDPTRDR